MKKRQNITTSLLLIIAIVAIINLLSFNYFFRVDFTKDKRFTLSKATKDILPNLKQPVTVEAYFSENLAPQIEEGRNQFKYLLEEFAARSGNKVVYKFINPSKSDTAEKLAMQKGIQPIPVQIREKDEIKNQQVFLGAIIKYGDKTDVLPFISPNGPMEYMLATSIKKLTLDKKPSVGFLQGNGEPLIQAMGQLGQTLSVLYNFQPINLTDSTQLPVDFKTLVLVDPKDTFKAGQLKQLDNFLSNGGKLCIAFSGLNGDMQNGSGKSIEIGFRNWLATKNIHMAPKFIIDRYCGSINVQQRLNGVIPYTSQVPFPFLPLIRNFANHPIVKGINQVMLPFASPLKYTGDTNKVKYVELATTSENSGLVDAPIVFDVQKKWDPKEFQLQYMPVAIALSGLGGNKDTRMVVIGCGIFATNGTGKEAMQQDEGNINLLSNSIDWLSDDTGLIDLRSKTVTIYPLKDLSDSARTILKYLNFLLPLLLVIIYGLIRMQMKRKVRTKRMEETYD